MATDADLKKLMRALDPFARVYRINEILEPDLTRGMWHSCPTAWPTMQKCKDASDLLISLGYDFQAKR